jgi:tetratricopeptide (TPR) repeat protein
MRVIARLFYLAIATASLSSPALAGDAKVDASAKVSIKADVSAKGQAQAAAGDAACASGKHEAALAAYGEGFAQTRDAAFIYAMARVHQAMGHKDEAKAMFNIYLSASGKATLKYKAEAEAELGMKAKGAVGAAVGAVKDTTAKVADVGAGVFGAVKLGIAASVDASAKASAKTADDAYAAGKYEDAARGYLEAYSKSQQTVALYGAAQAKAQAGKGAEARGLLLGYLAAQPSGPHAKDAQTLLLALGGQASVAAKVAVKAKVSAGAQANADAGDKAFAAGKYTDAAKAYSEASAKNAADAALLYAKGVAQLYAGQTAEAAASLKAYLAASGNLEFKASAEAHLRACGAA